MQCHTGNQCTHFQLILFAIILYFTNAHFLQTKAFYQFDDHFPFIFAPTNIIFPLPLSNLLVTRRQFPINRFKIRIVVMEGEELISFGNAILPQS